MDINIQRHSLAHLLAYAVQIWAQNNKTQSRFGIGPVIKDGFYYDIDSDIKLTNQELTLLEESMKQLIQQNLDFTLKNLSLDEAIILFTQLNQPYKVELLKDLKQYGTTNLKEIESSLVNSSQPDTVSVYQTGEFVDLCRGPHVNNTQEITAAFKLTSLADAYWRGQETNPQLQRVYAVAFETPAELDAYLSQQAEAEKRDHKKLGKELDLFVFSDLVGAGLPLFTPKGTIIREELENFIQGLRVPLGYQRVRIPHITKKALYETSGHWQKFKDELFKITTREGHEFMLKPMNCPHHTQIYASRSRSYRELPIRYAEITTVYRDEQSGELSGLSRVRAITQDDSHVFCRLNQVTGEALKIWDLVDRFYEPFNMPLKIRFSRHDPTKFENYLGTAEVWAKAEEQLKSLISQRGIDYIDGLGEAAMYGPKIDFIAQDSLGRSWQLATIQLDFNQPERFNLTCVNEQGEDERVVMIHIAVMGAVERFLSVLIEHFAGAFPVWLAPIQVAILPVSEQFISQAQALAQTLQNENIRVEVDESNESVGKKIRTAEQAKIPYMLVFGQKETATDQLSIRARGSDTTTSLSRRDFTKLITKKIKNKALDL